MATSMDPSETPELPVLLSRLIDKTVGSEDVIGLRIKAQHINESVHNAGCGNIEGFHDVIEFDGASTDIDVTVVDKLVKLLSPRQPIPVDSMNKTILYVKETDCPSGYRFLQLGHLGENYNGWITKSLASVGDTTFLSSEMYKRQIMAYTTGTEPLLNQPVLSIRDAAVRSVDVTFCLKWESWPREAHEWTSRKRLFGWPSQNLVDKIMHGGCELLPLGDVNSRDQHLLWKVSFAPAERRLFHSLSNIQCKVYLLLKYLLQQINQTLNDAIGRAEILNAYFLKSALFLAVENSHQSFWQEHNLFFCFWFCYNILLSRVKSGFCPNFFMQTKNMFTRPVQVQHKEKIFQILNEFHQRKWMCLSIMKFFGPSILEQLSIDKDELLRPQTAESREWQHDVGVMECLKMDVPMYGSSKTAMQLCKAVNLLLKSQSESDEILSYHKTCVTLSTIAMNMYPDIMVATGNKAKYKSMKQCKHLIFPRAAIGTDLLYMATFYFHSGSYKKVLEICRHVISNSYFDVSEVNQIQAKRYMHDFCVKGLTLYHKLKMTFSSELKLEERFCPPLFHLEISKSPIGLSLPPLPYAMFLSFMCYHELRDLEGCEAALRNMIVLKYDKQQGGQKHWIVHTLLGICYQTKGDSRRAIRAYMDSINSHAALQEFNPAKERIDALQRSDSG